jgi:predicted ATPase
MIRRLTGGKALPVEVVQQIVAKTDGVPLFVEELTKAVLESAVLWETDGHYELTDPLPTLAIPDTLQDSLMARLDRLVTAKGLAQLGATLGRQFTYELLQAVAQLDDLTLQRELERLVQAELLYQRGLPPRAMYIFKHALIQEIAYHSLLKRTRQQYHQRIAQVLEERFPETAETQPELLAQHYTEAGMMAQAIPYWQRAGQRAIQRSAHVEAIGHLTKGLEVLKALSDGPERPQQELGFMTILGLALVATKGQANEEVERTYARARELCQQMGETQQLFLVLWGLLSFYVVRAELQAAWEVGEQLLTLAQRQHDTALLMVAHWALGQTLLFRGELAPARAHLEQGITLYDPQKYHSLGFLSGFPGDLGVFCLCFAAHTLWHLGYPDQALKRIHEALTLAQELGHPFSRALALDYAAMLYQFRREGHMAQESAAAAMTLCREQGFAYYLAWGTIMQGWALVVQGQREEGMAQMRHGLAAIRATGAELRQPYYLALLAEACGQTGQAEEGLAMLAEALAGAHKRGEYWREAELHRLKGELLLQSSVRGPQSEVLTPDSGLQTLDSEAEQCFHQALAITRRQQAKSYELRATVSLTRLWQRQGKGAEARQLLGDIYGWFTEGFDTVDLQEARALLEALS